MPVRNLLLSGVTAFAMTMPAYAQSGGSGSGAAAGGAAGTGGTAASLSATGGTATDPAVSRKSQQQNNQIEQSEKNAAISGSNTKPSPTGSGTVSAPGVGVGHAANGKPIGTPGSGLGSPGNSAGPTK